MPDKFTSSKYDLLMTPIDEEGNRTDNDPSTANPPTVIDPPDPMGLMHGLDRSSGRKGGAPPKGR